MPRESSIEFGIINIAMHAPHSHERYIELLNTVYKNKFVVRARGDNAALIGRFHEIKDETLPTWYGEIFRFVNLNQDEPWFNLESNEEAKEDDLSEINIPNHLKPHLSKFSFIFFPVGHRLYITTRSEKSTLGIELVKNIFERLFDKESITDIFQEVEVTVEPDRSQFEEIFKLHRLERLDIELVRPNPDDHEKDEKRLLKRLEKQNAKEMSVTLIANKHSTIEPDEETKILASVAASNGHVEAKGRDVHDKLIKQSCKINLVF